MDRSEAFEIIRMIAQGVDPYSDATYSRNRPENNPETIQALCIVLAELVESSDPVSPAVPDHTDMDPPSDFELLKTRPLGDYLNDLEKNAILRALEHTNFNKTRAAELLGLTFRQLRYKLDVHDLPRTRPQT
ncbi:MAG: helix-turn-helix domain-containing protein [Desulfobacterales bacterium]|jgi:DNA-binding NtrC family response regulator